MEIGFWNSVEWSYHEFYRAPASCGHVRFGTNANEVCIKNEYGSLEKLREST